MGAVVCPKCDGTRHVRGLKGWERCACVNAILDKVFIKPGIRGKLTTYPAEYHEREPFPMSDLTIGGSWNQFQPFKFMVWRSLAPHRDKGLRYDYIDAYRLVDIFFEHDTQYEFLRQLASLDLLIMVIGLADVPNKLLPALIAQVLTLRQDAGSPTWVFSPFSPTRLSEKYGPDVAELLGDVKALPGISTLDAPAKPAIGSPPRVGAITPRWK